MNIDVDLQRLLEAKQQQLAVLEAIRDDTVGDYPVPLVCAHCFQPEALCYCGDQLLWSIDQVVLKLRMDVRWP